MAITSTQKKPLTRTNMATGRYLDTGTAAAFTISCGFAPRYVKVVNVTSAGEGLNWLEWFEGMADDSAIKVQDAGTSEAGITLITTLGITPTADGFTVGLDTDLNVSSEQLSWLALA